MKFIHEDSEFDDLLRIVAAHNKVSLALVEKDYWVTHTLWALHDKGFTPDYDDNYYGRAHDACHGCHASSGRDHVATPLPD